MPAKKKKTKREGFGSIFTRLLDQIPDTVDFELPDWLNKSKPTDYIFIKRNIYLTKKIKRRLEDDGIFCSCNTTMGSSSVCARDCLCGLCEFLFVLCLPFGVGINECENSRKYFLYLVHLFCSLYVLYLVLFRTRDAFKWMLMSSCSSGCKCGSSCINKPFHQRPVKKMKVVKTEKCGSGIVADEDIKQGEFVIEYVGEVIDDKTCEERLWKMKHRGETNFYLCEINRDMVIDATYKGNKSRYINHSCCPNTEMHKWRIDGETRIGIFATRDIKRGEHLTYDYQFVQFGADQDCHCGAAICRQKLGVKANKPKMPSCNAGLELVACQVAVTSPKVKAILSGKDVYQNDVRQVDGSRHDANQRCAHNCIGEIVRIIRPMDSRTFGIVKRFDNNTRKHRIMFEDGSVEFLDMSKEDWEFCTF